MSTKNRQMWNWRILTAGVPQVFDDMDEDLEAIAHEIEREHRFDQKVGKENE